MMKATKIHMNTGCEASNNEIDINSIYLIGCTNPGWFLKEVLYDYLKEHPETIQVNRYPFPYLVPVLSSKNEKYVRSEPDEFKRDNLLSLPRE